MMVCMLVVVVILNSDYTIFNSFGGNDLKLDLKALDVKV